MDIGRNEPCPCGSGKKFKKCCGAPDSEGKTNPAGVVSDEIHEALAGKQFGSLAEVNAFVNQHMGQRNRAPIDDFDGLSSEHLHRFLHFPFDSPNLVTFPASVAEPAAAAVLMLFSLLAEGIDSGELKATGTGNLSRAFCREAAERFMGEEGYRKRTRYGGINSESDFPDLNTTRIVAEQAGLIKKHRGIFILGSECKRKLSDHGLAGIFLPLLLAYATKFNWGYRDRYPEVGIIQQSFLFTLYELARHGETWRPHTFYEDAFLRAFPQALEGWVPNSVFKPDEEVRSCYTLRTLLNFAEFFGLAEVEQESSDKHEYKYRVRKSPLLDEAVRFHLG